MSFLKRHESEFEVKPTQIGGAYKVYTTADSAQLIAQYDPNDQLIGCLPHLLGKGRMDAKILGVREDQSHPLDGLVLIEFDYENTKVPCAVDCPLYRLYQDDLQSENTLNLQVCAFQSQAKVFRDEKKFKKSPYGQLAAEGAFIPSGLFQPDGAPVDKPRPIAILAGRVLEAQLIKNRETKKSFWKCEVQSFGCSVTTAFDARSIKKKPTTDSIVAGSFKLSAVPVEPQ